MMFETSDIDEWTGSLRVWTYWTHPNAIPIRHTTIPAMRTADPLRAPPMNDTAFRSGMLMSDSPARADGMRDAASAAHAPICHALGIFILWEGLWETVGPNVAGPPKLAPVLFGPPPASIRPMDRVQELREVETRLCEALLGQGDAVLVIMGGNSDLYTLDPSLGVGRLRAEGDPLIGGPRRRQALRRPCLGPAVVVAGALPGRSFGNHLRFKHLGKLRRLVGVGDPRDERHVPVGMELVEAPGPVEERVPALVVGEVLRGTGVRHELHRPVRADLIEPVADVQRLVLVAHEVDDHAQRLELRDPPVPAALEDAHGLAGHVDHVVGVGVGPVGLVGIRAQREVDVVPLAVLREFGVEPERLGIGAERARVEQRGAQVVHVDGDRGQVVAAEYLHDVAARVGGQVLLGDERQGPVALRAPGVRGRGACQGKGEGGAGSAGFWGHACPQPRPFPPGLESLFWARAAPRGIPRQRLAFQARFPRDSRCRLPGWRNGRHFELKILTNAIDQLTTEVQRRT